MLYFPLMSGKASFKDKIHYGVQIAIVGGLTGAFAGVVVTLYNVLVELCEEFSRGYYHFFRTHPAFLPLLFLALFLGAIVIGGVLRVLPILRGSGFPQTEGATKGLIRFKWYNVLTGMFASSLFVVFMGLSAGSEGPSLMIGGACGYGVSDVLRRNPIVRRYQITGGACAGLAVALNAPLTGMVFAYEEAHKRFTPEVFVCSFSSVVVAVVVRNLLRPAVGMGKAAPFLAGFSFPVDPGLFFCLYALLASLIVSLAGVAFYFLLLRVRRVFKKLRFFFGLGKYTIPFLLAGAAGLITVHVMGGGVEFIRGLTGNADTMSVFGAPFWASLLIIVIVKFLVTVANTGADLPCCSSVPMMAMGAGIGALLRLVFVKIGMDPSAEYGNLLVALSMITFFTTVVKAPMTGIIMTVEMTWSFSFLLPAVLCVAVGYLVGSLFHTEPLYEKLLDEIVEEQERGKEKLLVRVRVEEAAAGKYVRDILWPYTALVTGIARGGERVVPKGATQLLFGDILTVEGEPEDRKEYLFVLSSLVGPVLESKTADTMSEDDGSVSQDTGPKR